MKNVSLSKSLILLACVAAVALLYVTGIGCPVRYILGVECPGCGITHALADCLRLDFAAAFRHNPMVFLLPPLFLWFIKDGKVFKNERLNNVFLWLILGIFGIYFILFLAF